MPEVRITVGQHHHEITCGEGEEASLRKAAAILHNEAQAFADSLGSLSETRLLLLVGLMLADKAVANDARLQKELEVLQGRLQDAQRELAAHKSELTALRDRIAPPEPPAPPPELPAEMTHTLAELAQRTEAIATKAEQASSRR
ncbi:MAG: cell division protein ZapA [Rhodobacteraceae bacterium]|nr:cell division protein ZapA [Paracoccaceae bacterium]